MKKFSIYFLVASLVATPLIAQQVKPKELKVSIIDVGQADSILIEFTNGKTMLVDGGNNADGKDVVEYIKGRGIKTVDVLVGTHPHEDHIGGLDDVIRAFQIGDIYIPTVKYDTQTFTDVINTAKTKGEKIHNIKVGTEIKIDDNVKIEVLSPVNDIYENINNYSPIIKIDYKDFEMLLTGDAEREIEEVLLKEYSGKNVLDVDVLKLGHHGSDTSSTKEFIEATSPKYSIASVGENNDYGHPSGDVLTRLTNAKSEVYRTDEKGTIVLTTDGSENGLTVVAKGKKKTTPVSVVQDNSKTVYVTGSGKKYHVKSCRYVNGGSATLTVKDAQTKGYEACKVCH